MTTQTDAIPTTVTLQTNKLKSPSLIDQSVPTTQFTFNNPEISQGSNEIKKFKERQHLETDPLEYERKGDDPGLVLIFNQEDFMDPTLGSRKGSRRDVNEITVCFQRHGYNIFTENILTNFTTNEIREALKKYAEMDLSTYNSLIVFFLSHGELFNRLHTSDGTIAAEEFWTAFKVNKGLNNKPKMFVFQACKGDGYSTTGIDSSSPSPGSSSKIIPAKTFSTGMLSPHLLIVYSSIEGNSSHRNTKTGTWFIQELCKNITAYGKRDDVISLLIRTNKCVSGNYYHEQEGTVRKQMPFFVSTLKKKFYLNRNKDRDLIIKLVKSNEEILKDLKEVKELIHEWLDEEKKKKK